MSKSLYIVATDPEPNYERETKLDGETYVFRYLYSDREDCVFLTISDISGEVLVSGVKLVTGSDLLKPYRANPKIPQGMLALYVNGSDDTVPGYDEIGKDYRTELVYYTEEIVL